MLPKTRLLLLIFIFFGLIFTNVSQTFAADPSVCPEGGFCMAEGNTCKGGDIISDTTCDPIGPPSCNTYGGYCRDLDTKCSSGSVAVIDSSCINTTNNKDGNACCYTSFNQFFSGKACCNKVAPPQGPPKCTNGGYCMDSNKPCNNGGTVVTDATCVHPMFNINGQACCYPANTPSPTPNTAICGKPDATGTCKDLSGNIISGATTCERNSTVCCSPKTGCDDVFPIENIVKGPTKAFFDALNPLKNNVSPALFEQLSTPGGIVSRILQFLFPIAGLVLFVMLVWGGFEILAKSAQGTKALEAGKNRITAAIVGFLLLFATYWMAQIIETIFGIVIV